MAIGKVKRYNEFRGWGFITGQDGEDYFVHWSFIEGGGYKFLRKDESVEFEPVNTYQGLQAHNVTYLRPKEDIRTVLKPNPFTPQEPVINPDKFAGRGETIRNAVDALYNNKNIIITGERGIGKSSVAYQLTYLCQGERALLDRLKIQTNGFDFAYLTGDHRCVPGNTLRDILDSLASSLRRHLSHLHEKKRTTVEWGVNLKLFKFTKKQETSAVEISDLVEQLISFVSHIYDEASIDFNGLIFLIDEIDCLPPEIPLGSFFKAATEGLRFKGFNNVSFIVAGVTGTMTKIITQHPSTSRLFETTELRRMTEQEIEEIMVISLRGTGIGIQENTRNRIILLADRFPEPVHLLGYHTFRFDTNSVLELDDLQKALNFVITELKRQEFTEIYQRAKGGLAEPILRTMAIDDKYEFSVGEISKKIGSNERVTALEMGEFASLGLIHKLGGGKYKLRDPLFKIYLRWVLGLQ